MNHTVIGWAAARLHSYRFGYRLTREIAIYLAIEHMGKGIAGQLLKLTENSCIDLGIHLPRCSSHYQQRTQPSIS